MSVLGVTRSLQRTLRIGSVATAVGLAVACSSPVADPPAQSAVASASAGGATAAPAASASAAAPAPPAKPPRPVADPAAVAAKVGTSCKRAKEDKAFFFIAPQDPVAGAPVRALVLPTAGAPLLEEPADGIVIVAPGSAPSNALVEHRSGPPSSVFGSTTLDSPGTVRLIAHKGGEVVACTDVGVAKSWARKPGGPQGIAWEATRAWDAELENVYSAWVEKLFDAPSDASLSAAALHEITKDPARNLLHDHLGLQEDAPPPKGLRLDPDCADLPYFLRAYFAWKVGLPFTYSACSRGGGGAPPRCQDSQSNHDPLDEPVTNRVRRFETFLRAELKNVVHSGTGRTLATDDKTDYYPVKLSAETIRPGSVYADPYGHILVVAKRVPQEGDGAGLLFAVDGQPDGTVARKRFWKGNFLFSLDDAAMGSPGFKRFRPVVVKPSGVAALSNAAIAKHPAYGDYSLEQTVGDAGAFYDKMDDVLSPGPLDPERAMLAAIDALEEQMQARVTSVENGEKHFRKGGGRIDMPNGPAIFETIGDWENFSTPSRDLRLLIATDVVRGFPALVARRPERFKMPPGRSVTEVVKGLEAKLADETKRRKVEYVRSDESKHTLSLADVLERTERLEMAYNPNDCPEVRWGASDGTPESATCKRRAPSDQRRKMEKVRAWFKDRKRPARG